MKRFSMFMLATLLAACDGPAPEPGPELVERAEVLQVIYQPGTRSDIKTTWEDTLLGSGNLPHTAKTIETPDKFSIAFKCQHGKFIVEDEGKGSRAESLWKKLDKGDLVDVRYREIKRLDESSVDYQFIDAVKVEKK